jgi:3D-(3,5/4)-trihydroxycyclohexane-1,2-dione acylhydrolase (decyclizing)
VTIVTPTQAPTQVTPKTRKLTTAQAIILYLAAQQTELLDGGIAPLFGAIWGIFGHGNVAGIGEALETYSDTLPFYRGQNEQSMAHAAIAYAKAHKRRRMMAVTTSIGPGATNLTTAAALAHTNRLPTLLLPGDTFASRHPDPVLQQLEDPHSPLSTVNDCLRPVSVFFDRISRPEQLLASLPKALHFLTDPALCGPVTLALPQDVQAEAYEFPLSFFEPKIHYIRRPEPDHTEVQHCANLIRHAQRPLLISGGGTVYSGASQALASFCETHQIPFAETQAGKSILPWNHSYNLGAIGVTGADAANLVAQKADLVINVGTRLSDFTTASKSLFRDSSVQFINININSLDSLKLNGHSCTGDAQRCLQLLSQSLSSHKQTAAYQDEWKTYIASWQKKQEELFQSKHALPSDAQVIDKVNQIAGLDSIVICAAGGLPGELHRHWKSQSSGSYHAEYAFSCMGYEIAAGIGVKLASPEKQVFVMVGDGSYLMMHSELLTAQQYGLKINIIVLDNNGFGCINRLQKSCGSTSFGNLLKKEQGLDFLKNAQSFGCHAEKANSLEELSQCLVRNKMSDNTCVTIIETSPEYTTPGSAWWNVPIAETSTNKNIQTAYTHYRQQLEEL